SRFCPSESKELSISAFLTADQQAQLFDRVISQVVGFIRESDRLVFKRRSDAVVLTSLSVWAEEPERRAGLRDRAVGWQAPSEAMSNDLAGETARTCSSLHRQNSGSPPRRKSDSW